MRGDLRRLLPVCLSVILAVATGVSSEPGSLAVERHGDLLRLSAPGLHFLTGAPLEQLRNGASVTFVFSVTVVTDGSVSARFRASEPFVVSYDLWEERFSVTRSRAPARAASRLPAGEAEAWCLDACRCRYRRCRRKKPS